MICNTTCTITPMTCTPTSVRARTHEYTATLHARVCAQLVAIQTPAQFTDARAHTDAFSRAEVMLGTARLPPYPRHLHRVLASSLYSQRSLLNSGAQELAALLPRWLLLLLLLLLLHSSRVLGGVTTPCLLLRHLTPVRLAIPAACVVPSLFLYPFPALSRLCHPFATSTTPFSCCAFPSPTAVTGTVSKSVASTPSLPLFSLGERYWMFSVSCLSPQWPWMRNSGCLSPSSAHSPYPSPCHASSPL